MPVLGVIVVRNLSVAGFARSDARNERFSTQRIRYVPALSVVRLLLHRCRPFCLTDCVTAPALTVVTGVVMITVRRVTLMIGVPITGIGAVLPLALPSAGRRIMRVRSAILSVCMVRQSSWRTPPVSPELGFQDQ